MRIILLAFTVFFISNLYAQRVCSSSHRSQTFDNTLQNIRIAETISGITGADAPTGIIRIPVVVHVMYQTGVQNISDDQIKSGIAALNRDFRRQNGDTVNTPARFRALGADVEIEFQLATSNPRGLATSGIVRKSTMVKEWTTDDKIKSTAAGGDDAWDAAQYLNIWIGNMPRTLGYSSIPGDPKAVDGIVIHYDAFGTLGKSGAYNMGRTLVHEVGHWLGLKHIWGDTACGDDGIDDTPKQGGFTSGCPSKFLSSCSNGTQGDMYMNYMDFTNDACMNLFTLGQKSKMRAQFTGNGPRRSMLLSNGLSEPTMEEAPVVSTPVNGEPIPSSTTSGQEVVYKPFLHPNPSTGYIQFMLPDATWLGKELSIIDVNGTKVKRVVITTLQQKILLEELPSGVYFLQGRNSGRQISSKFILTASGQ